MRTGRRPVLLAAFGAIYLFWGSTYLAMRYAVVDLPPFFMAGTRYLVAGGALYLWLRRRGVPRPSGRHWGPAAGVGGLMLLCGNGGVSWAEQHVPSGMTALLLGSMPMYMVLIDWSLHPTRRPSGRVVTGLLAGLGGLALLAAPGKLAGASAPDLAGSVVILLAALCWAAGSILSTRTGAPRSALMAAAMQMLCGGTMLIALSAGTEKWTDIRPGAPSLIAWGYLVVFGSWFGYSAYIWLMRVSTPARVGTVSYVNPVIAVFLGWRIAGEAVTVRMILAAVLIVGAVVVIIRSKSYARDQEEERS